MKSAKTKLDPRTFDQKSFDSSMKMVAILGWLRNERITEPAIKEFCVTSDGYLLVRHENEAGFTFFSSVSDFKNNIWGIADVAELDNNEKQWLENQLHTIRGFADFAA